MGKRPEMQDKLALERDLFWIAAGFLTVLPVPADLPEWYPWWDEPRFS